jgi:hypothetical protein
MPTIHNLKISPEKLNVLRRIGTGDQRPANTQIQQMMNELLDEYLQSIPLHPIIVYKIHSISGVQSDRVYFDSDTYLTSESIAALYPRVKAVAVAICTIGADLENKVKELMGSGEQLRGFVLDGIGNAALDALAEETCHIIKAEATSLGYTSGSPLSPGMPGIAISEQQTLFKLARAKERDIALTSQNFMVPVKSLSMVICIGLKIPTWSKSEMCDRCNLHKTCRYKMRPDECKFDKIY